MRSPISTTVTCIIYQIISNIVVVIESNISWKIRYSSVVIQSFKDLHYFDIMTAIDPPLLSI